MSVPVAPGRLPLLGHSIPLLRRRHEFTGALREHGDVVRLDLGTVRTYFVTNPRLVHELLVTKGSSFRKGALFDKFRPIFGNGLATSDGAFHRRQRRMVAPAFHKDRIAAYANTIARAAGDLTATWRPGQVRVVEEVRRSLFTVLKQGMVRALSPSFVERVPLRANREFDAAIERMRAIVLEVHDEVMTLLVGGVETTALALAWTFHELGRHPDVERRVLDEVDTVLAGRPPVFADVEKLVYLNQVVNEVLREYPVWFLMRRALEPVELGGVPLPEGAEVVFSPHALHHDPASFPDPHRFDPDRWSPDRAARVPKGAFVPFGAGARQCVGNLFARTEIVVTAATVLSRWRLVPVAGKPVRVKFTSAAYPSGLLMRAVPRT